MKRLLLLLAALLACGLIAAGCGDDDDDGGDDSPLTTETAPTETTPTDEDTSSEDLDDLDSVDEAVEACKESVTSTGQTLSDDLQSDLEQLCEDAADGDEEEVREASLEICKRIVEETIPDEATREQAIAACETAVE